MINANAIGVAAVVCIAVLISFMRSSVNRKDLVFSEVDNGTIEVSVSASGKVVPAFEEIINSPINTRIVEVYRKGGEGSSGFILFILYKFFRRIPYFWEMEYIDSPPRTT